MPQVWDWFLSQRRRRVKPLALNLTQSERRLGSFFGKNHLALLMNETTQWQLVGIFQIISLMIWVYMVYRLIRIEKAIEESDRSNRNIAIQQLMARWNTNDDIED